MTLPTRKDARQNLSFGFQYFYLMMLFAAVIVASCGLIALGVFLAALAVLAVYGVIGFWVIAIPFGVVTALTGIFFLGSYGQAKRIWR